MELSRPAQRALLATLLAARNSALCHPRRQQIPPGLSEARNCAKSFTKRIHYRPPDASVSKTSMAAHRLKSGIEQQYRLTQSRGLTEKIVWPKRESKSTQQKKTSESKQNIRTRIRTSAATSEDTTTPRSLNTP